MPRGSRIKSETGIYHIMAKSSEEIVAFKLEENKKLILRSLSEMVEEKRCVIYAYCVMDNHIHLVLNEMNDDISKIMNTLKSKISKLFRMNNAYNGKVFGNRFRSEPIVSDDYLFAVIRYVHNNPIKAKMVNKISNYRWSSYNDYINGGSDIVDVSYFLDYYSKNKDEAISGYIEFHKIEDDINTIDC